MKFVYLIAVCLSDDSECEIHMNTANEIPNSLHKCVEGMKLTFLRDTHCQRANSFVLGSRRKLLCVCFENKKL